MFVLKQVVLSFQVCEQMTDSLQCTSYYDYHNSDDWREQWSIGNTVVIEQRCFNNITTIIDHHNKSIITNRQSPFLDGYPTYSITFDDAVEQKLMHTLRTCDCRGCQLDKNW